MVKFRARSVFILVAFASLISACGGAAGNGTSNGQNTAVRSADSNNAARTNVEELGVLIKVPYTAEDIVWKEYNGKKRIVAVMRFSPADANRIVAEAGTPGNPETSIAVESWFPDELIAQSEMSGDAAVRGRSYPAIAFTQEPYTIGKITRVEGTDYFILEMLAK